MKDVLDLLGLSVNCKLLESNLNSSGISHKIGYVSCLNSSHNSSSKYFMQYSAATKKMQFPFQIKSTKSDKQKGNIN